MAVFTPAAIVDADNGKNFGYGGERTLPHGRYRRLGRSSQDGEPAIDPDRIARADRRRLRIHVATW